MKSLVYQERIYDYSSEKEANKHKMEMQDKGWAVKEDIYENGGKDYPYTIEYYK